MTSIDLASNSALLQVAEKLAEQNALLGKVAIRGESAFIRYSAYADGTDFTETWSAGQNYIGHATGLEAPTDKEGYTWSLFASNIRETLTVTLKKNDWLNNTQIIETVQLGETGSVFPSPKPESQEAYLEAGIVISAATDNALVFTCLEVPEVDLVVDIQVTEPLAVIGGTGVSSWNELLDKPFGEYKEERSEFTTITWDGEVGDRYVLEGMDLDGMSMNFVHISDLVLDKEANIDNSYAIMANGAETDKMMFRELEEIREGMVSETTGLYIMSILEDNTTLESLPYISDEPFVVSKKGTYFFFIKTDGAVTGYVKEAAAFLKGTFTEIKKLDEKYLPEPLAYETFEAVAEEMTVEWDGVVGDRTIVQTANGDTFVHVSDYVFPGEGATGAHTVGVLQGGSYVEESAPAEACGWYGEVGIVGTGFVISIPTDNTKLDMGDHSATINGLIFPKKGLYFMNIPDSCVVTKYTGILSDTRIVVKKLDEKYLPETIARTEYVDEMATRAKQEAENDVAVVLEDYTKKEELTWDNLGNKPFGEEPGVTTLVFDGQAHDRENHSFPGTAGIEPLVIKVSDETPATTDLIGQSYAIMYNNEVVNTGIFNADHFEPLPVEGSFGITIEVEEAEGIPAMLLVVEKAGISTGGVTLSAGIWLVNINEVYFSELSYISETGCIKKIDEKYLPDPIAYDRTKELNEFTTVEWDGIVGDRPKVDMNYYGGIETTAVYMGPYMPSPDLGIAENSVFGGKDTDQNGELVYREDKITEYYDMGSGIIGATFVLFIPEDNYTCDIDWGYLAQGTYTFPKKGMYFLHTWDVDHTFESMGVKISANLYYRIEDFKQIDEKFIPDTIARASDLQVLQEALGAYITDINALIGGDE
jgi:hypothetical protein